MIEQLPFDAFPTLGTTKLALLESFLSSTFKGQYQVSN